LLGDYSESVEILAPYDSSSRLAILLQLICYSKISDILCLYPSGFVFQIGQQEHLPADRLHNGKP
jgi:hypothetical protein